MRKKYIFGKKLYISVLTSILVLLTTVATTFAWVGVFANSTFENFTLKIEDSRLDEYNVEVSLDGINFSSEINFNDLKKQILLNWGYSEGQLYNQSRIDALFNALNQDQATTIPNIEDGKIKSFGVFRNLDGDITSKFFKFDFYISSKKVIDVNSSSSFNLDVYLNNGMLTGTVKSYTLMNSFTFPDSFVNPYLINDELKIPTGFIPIEGGRKIENAKVDSSYASRLGFEKFEVVDKGHPEQYTDASVPNSAVIYQVGSNYPIENQTTGVQCFGGILPDDYNIAVGYYNSTEYMYYSHKIKSVSIPTEILNTRAVDGATPDLILSSSNNHLIDSTNPNEQIGVDQMMKLRCYFWFEGWDADCFPVINFSKVFINIGLSMVNEEVF